MRAPCFAGLLCGASTLFAPSFALALQAAPPPDAPVVSPPAAPLPAEGAPAVAPPMEPVAPAPIPPPPPPAVAPEPPLPAPQTAPAPPPPRSERLPERGAAPLGDDTRPTTYTPKDVGFSVGLHIGVGAPFGTAGDGSLKNVAKGMVPIGIDAGWFFNPHLYVGAYFNYGIALAVESGQEECGDADDSCGVNILQFGVVAHWHFLPERTIDPWVGGGIGYDIINQSLSDEADTTGDSDESGALHGFDLKIEGGVDFKPLPFVGIGPYVELASGHYNSDTSSTSLHEWLTFGLRLRTNL